MGIPNWAHFVGIGGAGMSAIAQILLESGYKVSGSDLKTSDVTKRLQRYGATIYKGHSKDNVREGVEGVVISTAIPLDNVEVKEAYQRGIPVIKRAEMLGRLMKLQKGIAVAGAHGKTTTTSMISLLLEKGGFDPTVVVGGEVNDIGSNAKKGEGEYLVAEADESDGSFLLLEPFIVVVTNVEDDHLENYGTIREIQNAFKKFIRKVPQEGKIVLCNDDSFLKTLVNDFKNNVVTYGLEHPADFMAKDVTVNNGGTSAKVFYKEQYLGELKLSVPGKHNISNALAAIAVGHGLGLSFQEMAEILKSFRGVKRRFQLIGEKSGIKIIDDYAHHPTEIKATLKAASETHNGRIIAVFQPHRYSRTKQLYREFGEAFEDADQVIITSIYSAGEKEIPGVSAEKIAQIAREKKPGKKVLYLPDTNSILNYLHENVQSQDMIITLGAGDIWKVGVLFAQKLGA
ncbi:MAG: UDP-N-acetylmuramate--alanine ligase [Clostridia bacterium]|nr:UDP-N-acetylmuramate--alanine ligase [Clostridia bacterium]